MSAPNATTSSANTANTPPHGTAASLAARASGPITRLLGAWHALSPRERRLVALASGVVGIALVIGLFDWSQHEQRRLERSLPRAEARLEQVQEAATEIARLRGTPPATTPSGPALQEAVQAAAAARGLKLTIQAGGEGLQLKGQAPFDALVGLLAGLQKDQGLRVQRMEIQQQGEQASIDALLVAGAGS